MHTVLMIFVGVLIAVATFLLARLWETDRPLVGAALIIFLVLWLALSLVNLWIGVARAGHPVSAELFYFLIVFSLPAAAGFAAALSRTN